MARTLETSDQSGIFVVRVSGERHTSVEGNTSELVNIWSSVASEMKRAGLHRLLAVISARGTIRSLDINAFYRRLSEMGFTANMRLAIVFAVPEHERPVLQLGVDGAARDGWTIRHFVSESKAREWLETPQVANYGSPDGSVAIRNCHERVALPVVLSDDNYATDSVPQQLEILIATEPSGI